MQKTGTHYHIRVGPEEVVLYDNPPLAGPYCDIVLDDLDQAHNLMMSVVDGHFPGYLEPDEQDEAYEYVEEVTTMVKLDELESESYHIEYCGFEFTFSICTGCVPQGMN